MAICDEPISVEWMLLVINTTALPSRKICSRSASGTVAALKIQPALQRLVMFQIAQRRRRRDLQHHERISAGGGTQIAVLHPVACGGKLLEIFDRSCRSGRFSGRRRCGIQNTARAWAGFQPMRVRRKPTRRMRPKHGACSKTITRLVTLELA